MTRTKTTEIKALNPIAVALCCDKTMFWQAAFLLERLHTNDAHAKLDYYLFVADEPTEWLLDILHDDVSVVYPDPNGLLGAENESDRTPETHEAALRFTALDILSKHYEKVVYLDTDVFPRWGSVTELAALDMGYVPVAGVLDSFVWRGARRPKAREYLSHILPEGTAKYVNAGFLLINGPRYQAEETSAAAMDFLKTNPEFCKHHGQSALNAVLRSRWIELSPTWNWQSNFVNSCLIPVRNPRFVHFTGAVKPWNDKFKNLSEVYIASMHDFLRRHGIIVDNITPAFGGCPADLERRHCRIEDESSALEARKYLLPYLDRENFADAQAGIPTWGWAPPENEQSE